EQLNIYAESQIHWTIWLYKDIGYQGMVHVSRSSPYMQLIKSFVAKKQRLGLDFWGVVDKTGVSSTYDPFLSDIKKMIPEHLHDSKYPHHWNIERQFERVVRECLVSDYLNLEFAELFKGKSEQELDDLAASFKFENCVTRDKLTEILQADAAKSRVQNKDGQRQQPHAAAAHPATEKKQGHKAHHHHDRPGATHDFGRSFPGQHYPQPIPPLTSYMGQPHIAYNHFGGSFPGQQYPQSMPPLTSYTGQPHIAYNHFGGSFSEQQYPQAIPPSTVHPDPSHATYDHSNRFLQGRQHPQPVPPSADHSNLSHATYNHSSSILHGHGYTKSTPTQDQEPGQKHRTNGSNESSSLDRQELHKSKSLSPGKNRRSGQSRLPQDLESLCSAIDSGNDEDDDKDALRVPPSGQQPYPTGFSPSPPRGQGRPRSKPALESHSPLASPKSGDQRVQRTMASSSPSPPQGQGGRWKKPLKPDGEILSDRRKRRMPAAQESSSPRLSVEKLPAKRQRRLLVDHFDFSGADGDLTGSDLDFDEAIEKNNNKSEDISEGEDLSSQGPRHEDPRLVQFQRKRSPELGSNGFEEDAELEAVPFVDKAAARAQELKRKPNARFKCPLLSCNMTLPPSTTLKELWTHASDKEHLRGLYTQGSYPCELGCKEGFTDNLGRIYHYAIQKCAIETFPDYDCTQDGCAGPVDNGTSTRMQHWFRVHAPDAYASRDIVFKDEACALGFANRSLLHYHLWGGIKLDGFKGRGCTHLKQSVEVFKANDIVTYE
ncbi:cellulase, partial [Aureobasidium melanogenum]